LIDKQAQVEVMKLEGTNRKEKNLSGFRARMRTPDGQNVMGSQNKGRHRLAV